MTCRTESASGLAKHPAGPWAGSAYLAHRLAQPPPSRSRATIEAIAHVGVRVRQPRGAARSAGAIDQPIAGPAGLAGERALAPPLAPVLGAGRDHVLVVARIVVANARLAAHARAEHRGAAAVRTA